MPLLSTHSDSRRQSEVNSQALDIQVNQMTKSKIENKYFEQVIATNEASNVVKEQMPSVEQVECVVSIDTLDWLFVVCLLLAVGSYSLSLLNYMASSIVHFRIPDALANR